MLKLKVARRNKYTEVVEALNHWWAQQISDSLAKSIAFTFDAVNGWEFDMEAFSLGQSSAHQFTSYG